MNKCKQCGKDINNPKFCSHSCSAKFNNKISKRRLPEHSCKVCGKAINNKRRYCIEHQPERIDWDNITLGDLRSKYNTFHYHAKIREVAKRKSVRIKGISACEVCGYGKHIEVCHIKPISKFSLDTPVKEINVDYNLIVLCPNCHWELDNGLLKIVYQIFMKG